MVLLLQEQVRCGFAIAGTGSMWFCYGRNRVDVVFAIAGPGSMWFYYGRNRFDVVLLLQEHRSMWFCCCRNIGRCGFALAGTSVDVVLLLQEHRSMWFCYCGYRVDVVLLLQEHRSMWFCSCPCCPTMPFPQRRFGLPVDQTLCICHSVHLRSIYCLSFGRRGQPTSRDITGCLLLLVRQMETPVSSTKVAVHRRSPWLP